MRYVNEDMSRKLRALIVSTGKTMDEIAKEMNISRPTLSSRINGRRDFSREEMEKFANIVGEKPQNIFLHSCFLKRNNYALQYGCTFSRIVMHDCHIDSCIIHPLVSRIVNCKVTISIGIKKF